MRDKDTQKTKCLFPTVSRELSPPLVHVKDPRKRAGSASGKDGKQRHGDRKRMRGQTTSYEDWEAVPTEPDFTDK